jgi:hypothetical protein
MANAHRREVLLGFVAGAVGVPLSGTLFAAAVRTEPRGDGPLSVKEVGSLLGQHKVPGASLAIIQNGEIVATYGYGVAQPNHNPIERHYSFFRGPPGASRKLYLCDVSWPKSDKIVFATAAGSRVSQPTEAVKASRIAKWRRRPALAVSIAMLCSTRRADNLRKNCPLAACTAARAKRNFVIASTKAEQAVRMLRLFAICGSLASMHAALPAQYSGLT